MAILNYIPRTRQWEINSLIDEILLITEKSYPEDSIIDIIKGYIPGVDIAEHDFDGDTNTRGAIFKKSKDFKNPLIVIQKNQSKGAKTFTLGHEFGHYSLNHMGKANFMIDKEEYDGSDHMQREAEAQYFAATLLMPADKFNKLSDYLSVQQLAKRFGVSEAAVRVRKAWLDGPIRDEAL
jgi:Zn-dependent peptidase ImmA (M78 family)